MLTKEEIKQFIDKDKVSEAKQYSRVGIRYFNGDHDIKNYKLYYWNNDGVLTEDRFRSNIKISHSFFTEIVNQAAQYMLSGDHAFFRSDIPELQRELDTYFNSNDDFYAELYNLVSNCMIEGSSYMFAYMGADGMTHFQNANMFGIVEVSSNEASDACNHIIYWYRDRIDNGQTVVRKIQVWDSEQTYYYIQHDEGDLWKDPYEPINPRPHIIYTKDGEDGYFYENYGQIPFFRMDNNKERFSDLKPIKSIIDDYDMMNAGLSNNLQDASEYLVVIKGFAGENLDELAKNIKTKKIIGVDGAEGGDVDFRTVSIPYDARKLKMDEDEKNIYRFGMAFNSAQIGDGNITNIVIKSRYALLDMKCNKMAINLKKLFRKMLDIVLAEVNKKNNTSYQQTDVWFDLTREIITNAQDNAQIALLEAQTQGQLLNNILNVAQTIDDVTVLQQVCDILEVNYEEVMTRAKEKKAELPINLFNQIVPDNEE